MFYLYGIFDENDKYIRLHSDSLLKSYSTCTSLIEAPFFNLKYALVEAPVMRFKCDVKYMQLTNYLTERIKKNFVFFFFPSQNSEI